MPTVPKTSNAEVIKAALAMLDSGDIESITLVALAAKLGVRAPSLYKRFKDREDLISEVELEIVNEFGRSLSACELTPRALSTAYLAYARTYPARYKLMFARSASANAESMQARSKALEPALLALAPDYPRPEEALAVARILTCFLHGYVTMASSGAFRMGCDPSAIVDKALDLILAKP